ncbi:MAG TPA: hypothetical protein VGP78_06025 [Solirubrobacteraceae bacterium]|nr:hypothetical protein [Solirubrobacteraceae bacterium]
MSETVADFILARLRAWGIERVYAKATLRRILETGGAQDLLTIDRYVHLVGGCRMGVSTEDSVVDADHRA